MRKSFTRLFSLVMFLTLLSTVSMAAVPPITGVGKPSGATALTKTTDKIMVIYPEAVQASTGSVRVTKTTGGTLVAVLPATDSRISYAKGDTVVVDLSASLQELTDYTVSLDASTFKTVKDGTASDIYSWAFTTGDYTAPTLKAVVPVNGTTLLTSQNTVALAMTFDDASKTIFKGTGKVAIYKADGNLWDFISVSPTAVGVTLVQDLVNTNLWTLTLPTSRVLEDNTTYSVTITAGTVTDNGLRADNITAKPVLNAYAGLTDRSLWKFTTKDYSAPGFATGYPKIGTVTNNSASVLIKTAEAGKAYAIISTTAPTYVNGVITSPTAAAVLGNASKKTVTIATAGSEYSIDFPGLSPEGTQEYIYVVTENTDLVQGTVVSVVKPKLSETTPPTLTLVKYYKGTTDKATGTVGANVSTTAGIPIPASFGGGFAIDQTIDNIILTFSEDVKIGAGNVIIYKASDNSVFATVAAASLTLTGDDPLTVAVETPKVKIPVSGLQNNTKYYVTIPNTLILDSYDNKYVGIPSVTGWAFQTNDTVAPTFTYTPTEGAMNQKQDVNIVLTFNELISATAGFDITAAYNAVGTVNPFTVKVNNSPVAFSVTPSNNDGKFTSYVIDLIPSPATIFPSNAVVTVQIAASSLANIGGKVVDVAGQGINFIVEDKAAPQISSWSVVTKPSQSEVLTFNEAIYLAGGGEITDATLPSILTVKLGSSAGVNVAYTATIDAAKKKITITPVTPWASETTYFFAISASLQDASGNAFCDATGTPFAGVNRITTATIVDVTSATVDLSSVDGKTISTSDDILLAFNEGTGIETRTFLYYAGAWNAYSNANMNKVIIFKEGSATGPDVTFATTTIDNATFKIVASPALKGNTTYYLGVGASTKGGDANVNLANVNIAKFVTFTTKSEGKPKVVSLSPADGSSQIAAATKLVITFDTDVADPTIVPGNIVITGGTSPYNVADADVVVSGKVATITLPSNTLVTDKSYNVAVAASVFKNVNSALTNDAFALDAWDFKTTDTKVDLATLVPDNTTGSGVAIDAQLKMTFNEKVVKGLGTFKIWNATTNGLVESIDVVSSQVVLSDDQKTITITPSAKFTYNTLYYVEVLAGTLKDLVGNGSLEISGTTTSSALTNWTFYTENPALTIDNVTSSPANGADKVAGSTAISITFNREIAAVTGNNSVGYFEGLAATTAQSYILGSSNVSISGKTLTITHADKLFPANTAIYLYLPAGVIKAANDASLVNSLVNQTTAVYTFNTGDVNPPVPTFTPAAFNSLSPNPVYTAIDSNITITFDEDIFNIGGTAVSSGDVNLTGANALFTISPSVTFSGTISGKTVTLHPTSNLAPFTQYTVAIVGDKIKDSKGTVITSALVSLNPTKYTSTFYTVDNAKPLITDFVLDGGDKQITVPAITIADDNNNNFYYLLRVKSSAAAPTAAEIKSANFIDATSGTVATFDITSLVASTDYQFYYVADDTFGNTSDVAVLEASTDDTVAPLLVSTSPATGAVDVDVLPAGNALVKLTFNENVGVGTGVITVRDYATQAILLTKTIPDGTVLIPTSGDTKSLNLIIPAATFTTAPQKVYVEISAGTIKDGANNPYAGLFGTDVLAFTTEDNASPTVDVANSTATGTSGVALDATIKVAFSENVKAGTGNLILYRGTTALDGTVSPVTGNAIQVFTAAEATFSGKTATVKPTAALLNSYSYRLGVEIGFAKDLSSNANANVADASVIFTATPDVLLSVAGVTPAGGTTAIAKTSLANIAVTFSGNVYLTVAGYSKPLALMTQAELLAHVSLVDGNGVAVAIAQVNKVGATGITIIPATGALKDQTNYTLTISGFENSTGTVMVNKVVNYLSSDATAPIIVFSPAFNTTKIDPATTLSLTFNESIVDDAINPNSNIYSYIDNTNVKNFVYLREAAVNGTDVDFTATISGKVISIVPAAKLKSGIVYYYGLKRTVEDMSGAAIIAEATPTVPGSYTNLDPTEAPNAHTILTGIEKTTYVYFTAADYTAPALATFTSTNHNPQGAGITATASMYVDFTEPITISTGSIVIRREDGSIFQTISGAGLSIGSSVTTAPLNTNRLKIAHNDFEPFMNYFVEVGASVVVDATGNGNTKFSDPLPATGWLFTTNDTYALTATVSPKGDNTPRSISLEMDFNKVPTGVANKFIAVYKADGTAVAQIAVAPLIANGRVITAPVALDANQAYYARVEAGAFVDNSGNTFAGIMDNSWVFSTVNNIAPQVVTLAPADNALSVDASTKAFTMTFDRNVAVGTGVISVRYAVDGKVFEDVDVTKAVVNAKTLTFNVTKALDANTAFYVYVPVGAITNTEVTKDSFAGILNTYDWNFTTSTDKTAPLLLTWTPNATTLTTEKNHPTFVMTFDDALVFGAGNVVVYKKSDNKVALTIPVTAAMVSGKTVTVTYVAPTTGGLDQNTDYYVLVDAGIVKDAAGNAVAAITDVTKWTFKTGAGFITGTDPKIDNSLEFKVYPNPFVEQVTVDNVSDLSKVVISNIAGQVVKEIVTPENPIQLNELRSGVYFISLYQDGAVIKTVKLLKR